MWNKIVEGLSAMTTSSEQILPDILAMDFTVVKAFFIGEPKDQDNEWTLVDTGLENSADFIIKCAEERFGEASRPEAIILTHGHFDHVGSVIKLAQFWDVSVFIHELEMPYVTGKKDYPLGDPSVDSGIIAKMSKTFPHTSIDISNYVKPLPNDGTVPGMPGWKWIHTPGHTEGQVCLFRESDRTLIAADAFTTVKQESLLSVITQSEEINGPPKYFTMNFHEAEASVNRLRNLHPKLGIPSHGKPLSGEELTKHLDYLAENFKKIAVPQESGLGLY